MLSKRLLVIAGATFVFVASIVVLSLSSSRIPSHGVGRIALIFVAPVQGVVTDSIRALKSTWYTYFAHISAAQENVRLKRELRQAEARISRFHEIELANIRLRRLLDFKINLGGQAVAAEVVGKDPSPWYRTVIINKGSSDGLRKGLPVSVPEGVAGQVTDVSAQYAKVMLIIDRNSAVDAFVQRTRARGIIKGESTLSCVFQYALRKDEVKVGDEIVASGLDGVYPKGMPIGEVTGVVKRAAGIFQEVTVTPHVDFEKLEEALVILTPQKDSLTSQP
jgi:rod shape-determining protein MreC